MPSSSRTRARARTRTPAVWQITRTWQLLTIIAVLLLTILSQQTIVVVVDAYRLGDAIDTEILTPKDSIAQHAPKRSQMPIFGVDTSTTFGPIMDSKFSIHFEEGFRALPWINTQSFLGGTLEKVEITFVFSRSGGGEIHSLSSHPIYSSTNNKKGPATVTGEEIVVEYKWIEEEAVDINGGAFVLFLAIFVSSLFMLVDLCGLCETGDDEDEDYAAHRHYTDRHHPTAIATGGSRIPKNE